MWLVNGDYVNFTGNYCQFLWLIVVLLLLKMFVYYFKGITEYDCLSVEKKKLDLGIFYIYFVQFLAPLFFVYKFNSWQIAGR